MSPSVIAVANCFLLLSSLLFVPLRISLSYYHEVSSCEACNVTTTLHEVFRELDSIFSSKRLVVRVDHHPQNFLYFVSSAFNVIVRNIDVLTNPFNLAASTYSCLFPARSMTRSSTSALGCVMPVTTHAGKAGCTAWFRLGLLERCRLGLSLRLLRRVGWSSHHRRRIILCDTTMRRNLMRGYRLEGAVNV